jgi:hypothetical protein
MDAKLTLKLDQDIIRRAKKYAKNKNTSLSRLIENQLRLLVTDLKKEKSFSPEVNYFIGILKK